MPSTGSLQEPVFMPVSWIMSSVEIQKWTFIVVADHKKVMSSVAYQFEKKSHNISIMFTHVLLFFFNFAVQPLLTFEI